MADKYSTIQQHQPLRVPSSFDKQGRALIVQLDEILDDIYRRFGRLRFEDLGKKLQNRIENDEGDMSEIVQNVDKIFLVVQNRDGDMSGVELTAGGLDLTGTKHIKLQSGNSIVLIDPSQINMNTEGLVSILGRDDSIIKLVGGSDNDQTVFQADADGGVQAKDISTESVNATSMTVTNLNVTGTMTNSGAPAIVCQDTRPTGHNIIWLKPQSSEPFSTTGSVEDGVARAWSGTYQSWKQTCNLPSTIAAEGATKAKIVGQLYKNGSDSRAVGTLKAKLILSDNSIIDLETIGTFPSGKSLKWNYGFSHEKDISVQGNKTVTAVEFEYSLNTSDPTGNYSYTNNVTLTISGDTGSGQSDLCEVHFIA